MPHIVHLQALQRVLQRLGLLCVGGLWCFLLAAASSRFRLPACFRTRI